VPSRRLNFSLVLVELPHKFEKTQEQSHGDNKAEEKDNETKGETAFKISADETEPYVPHILLHGGMDEKVTSNLQHGQNPSCQVVRKRKNSWSTWNLMEF